MNMEGRSSPSRREPLDDEAILDHLSETALAETEELAPPPMAQPPDEDPLSAEMFLDIAAGSLGRRVDRAELIERLRSRVLPAKTPTRQRRRACRLGASDTAGTRRERRRACRLGASDTAGTKRRADCAALLRRAG